jgi:hypothetical protein
MGIYQPLSEYLKAAKTTHVVMTFQQIEDVLNRSLPPSSRAHRAWWANNPTDHVQAKAWSAAGYVTDEVDLAAGRVVFAKNGAEAPPKRHPAFGAMKGMIHFVDGVDLTAPAWPAWEKDAENDWFYRSLDPNV